MAGVRARRKRWKNTGMFFILIAVGVLLYPFFTDINAWLSQGEYRVQMQQQSGVIDATGGLIMPNSGGIAPWAQLEIPELGLKLVVVEGTSQEALALGPGWYTQTALPGQGNTAIAGHRTMYGGPFRNIHELAAGNVIILTYHNQVYNYKVEAVESIGSNDWSMINPCGYNALTLTTCTPEGQDKRIAVRARMVEQ